MAAFIDDEYATQTCRMGAGEDTCAFLVMAAGEGGPGFVCAKDQDGLYFAILARLEAGTMKAQGDNCGGWAEVIDRERP